MAKILKFVSFQQLLKHILRAFSSLGGKKSDDCGLGHSGSQPFISLLEVQKQMHRLWLWPHTVWNEKTVFITDLNTVISNALAQS